MFKQYVGTTAPYVGNAFQLTEDISVVKESEEFTYAASIPIYQGMCRVIYFKSGVVPQVGDWIMRRNGDQTHLVTDAIFREQYLVHDELRAA